jgi:hypothetical protein
VFQALPPLHGLAAIVVVLHRACARAGDQARPNIRRSRPGRGGRRLGRPLVGEKPYVFALPVNDGKELGALLGSAIEVG